MRITADALQVGNTILAFDQEYQVTEISEYQGRLIISGTNGFGQTMSPKSKLWIKSR